MLLRIQTCAHRKLEPHTVSKVRRVFRHLFLKKPAVPLPSGYIVVVERSVPCAFDLTDAVLLAERAILQPELEC